jgi:phospholipid/cholesterol/gamma-HCH transport system substrate-binding protein
MTDFYQDQRKIELRVGIIAILCLVILVFGYAWLRNALHLRAMTQVKIKFENAQGLELGDKVTVNGMEAGRVTKIEQMADGVLIQSKLQLKYPLRQGARFVIQDSNLMGGKQLDITNSSAGAPLDTKLVQSGENAYGMTALLSTASVTMQNINALLVEMNKPDGFFSSVKATFEETKSTFSNVNETITGSKEDLSNALKQISSSAQQLSDLLSQNRPKLDQAISLAPGLLQKTQAALDSLQFASSALRTAVNELTTGKGTLPSLIQDDKLYQNLLESSAKLDSLLIDVKKNPKRYFRLKVF